MKPHTSLQRARRRVAIPIGVSIVALTLALASPAGAGHLEPGMSISVSGPVQLVNHVYLAASVSVTCPDLGLDATHFVQSETIDVFVQQKVSGGTITSGLGELTYQDGTVFGGGVSGTPLTCDGRPHTYSVPVYVSTSNSGIGVAFKGGKAVAFADGDIFIQDTPTFRGDSNAVGTGPVPINIKG